MRTDLAEELPKITADRVQLQQAFMNLMLNGVEAMRDAGGDLKIKSQLNEDGQLHISVTDNGVGLPAERADQIFNAFFTTKPHGTGMGLAITRSIVESHGGRVWAATNDDSRMRAAMQRLLKTVGLHSESFATPQDFLQRKLLDGIVPPQNLAATWNQILGSR